MKVINKNKLKTLKDTLGFEPTGSITIFKGDTYPYLEWFRASGARYRKSWGWYFLSGVNVPEDLPNDISPLTLNWSDIAVDEDNLKSEKEVTNFLDSLLYDEGEGEWVGQIGDRIEVYLTVDKATPVEGSYGNSTFHVMHDDLGNIYTWSTSARTLVEGETYNIRGTIKALNTYKNCKQNQLTRCYIR